MSLIDFLNMHIEKNAGVNKYVEDKFLDVKEVNCKELRVYSSDNISLYELPSTQPAVGDNVLTKITGLEKLVWRNVSIRQPLQYFLGRSDELRQIPNPFVDYFPSFSIRTNIVGSQISYDDANTTITIQPFAEPTNYELELNTNVLNSTGFVSGIYGGFVINGVDDAIENRNFLIPLNGTITFIVNRVVNVNAPTTIRVVFRSQNMNLQISNISCIVRVL